MLRWGSRALFYIGGGGGAPRAGGEGGGGKGGTRPVSKLYKNHTVNANNKTLS